MKLPHSESEPNRKQAENREKAEQAEKIEKVEKIRSSEDDLAAHNPYYAAIARGYHLAQLALFSLLAAFVILSMLIRSDDITYENFFYLFKDLHAAVDSEDVTFTSLVYNADETQSFAVYRGGLAVAGESGLTVFTATGRQSLVQSLNMTAPRLLTSTRCILVYEQGGHDFALYNSFARIHAGQSEGELSCAAISDAGWFALAELQESSSRISVYDKHTELKTEFFKNGYTTALAMNRQGNLLAIVMTDAVDGIYQTNVSLYRPGTDRVISEWSFSGLFPLACSFADDDTLLLTGMDRMLILDRNGEIRSDVSYEEKILRAFHTEVGYALLLDDDRLLICDSDGELVDERTDQGDVRSVLIGKKMIYIMSENSLTVYDVAREESSVLTYDFPLQKLLWYAENELLLCSRSTARYLDLSLQ